MRRPRLPSQDTVEACVGVCAPAGPLPALTRSRGVSVFPAFDRVVPWADGFHAPAMSRGCEQKPGYTLERLTCSSKSLRSSPCTLKACCPTHTYVRLCFW